MGRGRAPCCEKVGLNKGSWTPEEDMRLMAYIQRHGHANWRALPKQAGLLRCGKSCRLRWINYLRPDIKRGNFTKEEEESIIRLHGLLGNKWSKIASCLPGRTDNEIKNVWNTHLKKRVAAKEKNNSKENDVPNSPTTSCEALSTDPNENSANIMIQDEKIEIPIEPSLDLWDMLGDPVFFQPPSDRFLENDDINSWNSFDLPLEDTHCKESSSSSSSNFMVTNNELEPSGDGCGFDGDIHKNPIRMEEEYSKKEEEEEEERKRWLAHLEEELELWGSSSSSSSDTDPKIQQSLESDDCVLGSMENDPVLFYFQTSPLELLQFQVS